MDKKEINFEDFKNIFKEIQKEFASKAMYLCELDSVIGDGDHGTTILKGFRSALKKIEEEKPADIKSLILAAGDAIMDSAGGVTGVVFGSIFQKISEPMPEGELSFKEADFTRILKEGIEAFLSMPKIAKPGEKTMVDALYPALKSMEKSAHEGKSFKEIMEQMAYSASRGAESTREMIASKGRARYLKERSIGYQDPGATSVAIIMKSFLVIFN